MSYAAAASLPQVEAAAFSDYRHIRVDPISPYLGAEIGGVDLSRPLSEAVFAEVRRAFVEFSVIFFRDQRLTPEQHIAFARRFGRIDINRFFKAVDGHPEIAEVRKEAEQKSNIGGSWHTDHSYDQIPALGSMLYARELPPVGGDTLFSSMVAAFEALSPDCRKPCWDCARCIPAVMCLGQQRGGRRRAIWRAASAMPNSPPRTRSIRSSSPIPNPAARRSMSTAFHGSDRRLVGRGIRSPARLSLPACGTTGIYRPLPATRLTHYGRGLPASCAARYQVRCEVAPVPTP